MDQVLATAVLLAATVFPLRLEGLDLTASRKCPPEVKRMLVVCFTADSGIKSFVLMTMEFQIFASATIRELVTATHHSGGITRTALCERL
jgi:hypothetical protein